MHNNSLYIYLSISVNGFWRKTVYVNHINHIISNNNHQNEWWTTQRYFVDQQVCIQLSDDKRLWYSSTQRNMMKDVFHICLWRDVTWRDVCLCIHWSYIVCVFSWRTVTTLLNWERPKQISLWWASVDKTWTMETQLLLSLWSGSSWEGTAYCQHTEADIIIISRGCNDVVHVM